MNAVKLTPDQDKEVIRQDLSKLMGNISNQIERLSEIPKIDEHKFFLAALRIKSSAMYVYIEFSNTKYKNKDTVIYLIGLYFEKVFIPSVKIDTIRIKLRTTQEVILAMLNEAEISDLSEQRLKTA